MNTTIFTGILLMLIGAYAVVRGILMGKPMDIRTTFVEVAFGFVGFAGIFYFSLGWFMIMVNYNMGMGA